MKSQKERKSNVLHHIFFFEGTSVLTTILDKPWTYAHKLRKYFSVTYVYNMINALKNAGIIEYETHGTINFIKLTPCGFEIAKSLKEVDTLIKKIEDESQKNIINRKHNI